MPERLDRVVILTTSGEEVELPWTSRDMLLNRLRPVPSVADIVAAFEAVGATRPVTLRDDQEVVLHNAIQEWVNETGARNLPAGIIDLRSALKDEDATGD